VAGNPALGRRAYVRCKALREGGAEEGGREGEARAREIEKVGESERCAFVLPEVQYNLLRRDRAGGEVLCVCMYTGGVQITHLTHLNPTTVHETASLRACS